jgi:hypothetical protein
MKLLSKTQGLAFRFQPFITPAGGIILVLSLTVLIRSLLARNAYEILLSSAVLLLLLVLGIIGGWKSKKLKSLEASWKPPFPMTAGAAEETIVSGLDIPMPFFFRLHFIVRGRFSIGGDSKRAAGFVEASTSAPRGKAGSSGARLVLDFPMSGVFQGEGYFRICDIFGFYSFACGIPQNRFYICRAFFFDSACQAETRVMCVYEAAIVQ